MKLTEFGKGGMASDNGIDLEYLIGWLESMVETEAESIENGKPSKHRDARLDRAYAALGALIEVSEWCPALTKFHTDKEKPNRKN